MAFRSGFVTILGLPNAGKSTLLNAMIGSKVAIVSDKPQTTRTAIQGVLTLDSQQAARWKILAALREELPPGSQDRTLPRGKSEPIAQVVFLDTPGIIASRSAPRNTSRNAPRNTLDRQMMDELRDALADRDLVLFVADASHRFGARDREALEWLPRSGVRCFLVLNKIDCVKKPVLLPLIDQYRNAHEFDEIIPVSALKQQNLSLLIDRIIVNLPEGPLYFPPEHITELPMRFLAGEIVREKAIQLTRQELPYASAVLVETFEDKGTLVHIGAEIFVEREGQKPILIGAGGQMLKQIGTLARQELEGTLGKKVFLELHVKVREHWREDSRFLEELDWRKMAGGD